ncbi:MAG TPA: hypothetical protein VJ022_07910 [Anaerolineales bacterium]|nr:hypothetical protein [Anaerolineales bacterium]
MIIPGKTGGPDGKEPGADVTFLTDVPSTATFFVPRSTHAEVCNNAESYLGGFFLSIDGVGDLYCQTFEEEQIP